MKTIGIIPARGGSQGIPLKNIRDFCGKPLIAWTILSALKSNLDRVIVTTDNEEIAKIAKEYGAEVPFLRPAELSTSTTAIEPVLLHVVDFLKENEGNEPDAIALIHSTSPLRQHFHINQAIDLMKETNSDSIVSVSEAIANQNPHWMLKKTDDGSVRLFTGEHLRDIKARRQELPTCYIRNDLIYLLKPENLREKKPNLYGNNVELYVTENLYDADINTEDDWLDAELRFKRILRNK